jgi:DNA-directed RNA polymerase specialized sigma24 family protein
MTPPATLELARSRQARADIAAAVQASRDARRAGVPEARAEGFTLAEIAEVLGVSYQRVWQIVNTTTEESA